MEPNSFDNNQLIPNQPLVSQKNSESHSKAKIVFVIIGIIILIGLIWWIIPSKKEKKVLTPEQKVALLQELSKTVVPITAQQKDALIKSLNESSAQSGVTLTPEQREALLKELDK